MVYPYIEWSSIVPLQMIDFYCILKAVKPEIQNQEKNNEDEDEEKKKEDKEDEVSRIEEVDEVKEEEETQTSLSGCASQKTSPTRSMPSSTSHSSTIVKITCQ